MAAEDDGEIDVPETAIQIIDIAVLAKLPAGTIGKSIERYGASYWTRTARLITTLDNGSTKSYFLKTSSGARGKAMFEGEMASMTAIYDASPEFAPQPIGWGTYVSDSDIHFFICEFRDMIIDELPDIEPFCANLAALHRKGKSPTKKYGFPLCTYQGNLPQDNSWTDTWEEFYIQGLKRMFELEEKSQGPSVELEELCVPLYEKVIPRLLRPLETGGRSIEPVLVHGDLWYGNAATDLETGMPIVYDACCFYAHNEYELGVWRAVRYRLGAPYRQAYHRYYPISAPVDDQDDRNVLYSIRSDICASALYTGNTDFRKMIINEIRRLVDKFPGGYEEWEKAQSPNQVDEGITKGPEMVRGGGVPSQSQDQVDEGITKESETVQGEGVASKFLIEGELRVYGVSNN